MLFGLNFIQDLLDAVQMTLGLFVTRQYEINSHVENMFSQDHANTMYT